jgi:hypothetical protein
MSGILGCPALIWLNCQTGNEKKCRARGRRPEFFAAPLIVIKAGLPLAVKVAVRTTRALKNKMGV